MAQTSKKKCENHYSESRIEITGVEDLSIYEIKPEKQIKRNAVSCDVLDEDQCAQELGKLDCEDETFRKVMVYEELQKEVYCTKTRPRRVGINQDKKAAKDVERAARKAERDERKAEIAELRTYLQTIKDSSLPNWHKKILRRLIKEIRD